MTTKEDVEQTRTIIFSIVIGVLLLSLILTKGCNVRTEIRETTKQHAIKSGMSVEQIKKLAAGCDLCGN